MANCSTARFACSMHDKVLLACLVEFVAETAWRKLRMDFMGWRLACRFVYPGRRLRKKTQLILLCSCLSEMDVMYHLSRLMISSHSGLRGRLIVGVWASRPGYCNRSCGTPHHEAEQRFITLQTLTIRSVKILPPVI